MELFDDIEKMNPSEDDLLNDLENTPEIQDFEDTTEFEEYFEDNDGKDTEKEEGGEDSKEGEPAPNPIADLFANLNVVALPYLTEKILNYFNREAKISINYDIKEELKKNYSVLLQSEFIDSLSPKQRAVLSIVMINASFIGTAFILSQEKESENIQKNNIKDTNFNFESSFNSNSSSEFNTNNSEDISVKKKRGRPRKKQVIEI